MLLQCQFRRFIRYCVVGHDRWDLWKCYTNNGIAENKINLAHFETLFDYFRYRDGDGQPIVVGSYRYADNV